MYVRNYPIPSQGTPKENNYNRNCRENSHISWSQDEGHFLSSALLGEADSGSFPGTETESREQKLAPAITHQKATAQEALVHVTAVTTGQSAAQTFV